MAVATNIGSIIVQSANTNAGVFTCENNQSSWNSTQKRMPGLAIVNGMYNLIPGNIIFQYDSDLTDTPVNNPSVSPSAIIQGV